jgi:periplasmic divalent cation tolerance protein
VSPEPVRVILITAPDEDTASGLARGLVEERLAACVNLVPGLRSIYRWQGAIEDEAEWLLIAKTTEARVEALRAHVVAHHPYEVPEVVALPVLAGHAPYLDWVVAQVAPEA